MYHPVVLGVEVLVKVIESARNLANAIRPLRERRIIGRSTILETFEDRYIFREKASSVS